MPLSRAFFAGSTIAKANTRIKTSDKMKSRLLRAYTQHQRGVFCDGANQRLLPSQI
jgi:hypothetical protein